MLSGRDILFFEYFKYGILNEEKQMLSKHGGEGGEGRDTQKKKLENYRTFYNKKIKRTVQDKKKQINKYTQQQQHINSQT